METKFQLEVFRDGRGHDVGTTQYQFNSLGELLEYLLGNNLSQCTEVKIYEITKNVVAFHASP